MFSEAGDSVNPGAHLSQFHRSAWWFATAIIMISKSQQSAQCSSDSLCLPQMLHAPGSCFDGVTFTLTINHSLHLKNLRADPPSVLHHHGWIKGSGHHQSTSVWQQVVSGLWLILWTFRSLLQTVYLYIEYTVFVCFGVEIFVHSCCSIGEEEVKMFGTERHVFWFPLIIITPYCPICYGNDAPHLTERWHHM